MYVEGYLCFSTLEKWPSLGVAHCVQTELSPSVSQGPGTPVPEQVLICVCELQFFKMLNHSFLASSVCQDPGGWPSPCPCGLIALAMCCP